ncbi:hypothetical protein CBR_g36654 [Chara braunii]|uniref:Uncharacterized protein n=1 Tax=Chara braunii TaxID=69332 RepID=A0A388LL24_CHABU|nr:hypothetical protein CBR_g36654 [Chara braunii]|eukprot:GBG83036.1 hypothetical protein CBR_g36654 [Chara braunii]
MAEIDPCVPIDVRIEGPGGIIFLKHPVFVRPEATFYEARLQIVVQNVWRDPFVFVVQKDGKASVLNTAQEALFRCTRGGLLLRPGGGGGGPSGEGKAEKPGTTKGVGKDNPRGAGKEKEKGKEVGGKPKDGGGEPKKPKFKDDGGMYYYEGKGRVDGEKIAAYDCPTPSNLGPKGPKPQKGSKSPPRRASSPTFSISKPWSDHQCHSLCHCHCRHPRTALMCNDPLRYWEIIAESLREKLRAENRTDRFHIIVGHEGGEDIVKDMLCLKRVRRRHQALWYFYWYALQRLLCGSVGKTRPSQQQVVVVEGENVEGGCRVSRNWKLTS